MYRAQQIAENTLYVQRRGFMKQSIWLKTTKYHQRISLQNPNALIIPNTETGNEPKTNRLEGFLDHSTSWIDQPVR